MRRYTLVKEGIALAFLFLFPLIANADTLNIHDDIQTYSSLSDTTVNMSGQSELHITDGTNPIPGCQINLNSSDSWFFLEQIKPSVVASTYLSQVQVNGSPAVLNSNVRVVEYVSGAVVIPHPPSYTPLQIYSGYHFSGTSQLLGLYTYYKGSASLGELNNNVSSFKLKRGYMATFAQNADGGGISRVYTAQDCDINIEVLPEELDNSISFIRVFPWRWTNKKGWAGGETSPSIHTAINAAWNYDWDNVAVSSLNTEYIPMRHDKDWNAYSNINNKQGSTAALGFNEPDKADQANMTVAQAIEQWPNLVASGLRIGSPATSDGGLSWLYNFIDQADALNYRVDFVAVHCYQGCYTASQWYNWLKAVHERTGRPLWVTEWNNGCNWTSCPPSSPEEQAQIIGQFIDTMDNAPFIERYSVYNWCSSRELVSNWNPIVLTPAGEVYRDNEAPMAYVQPPTDGSGGCAYYQFSDDTQDSSMFGNHGIAYGGASYTTGHSGKAIDLDGVNDYVAIPANLGDCTDFTFAAWVYWDGSSQWQRIFDFGRGTMYYMFLSPRSGGDTLRFAISTTSYSNEQRLETTQMATGLWVHLAVTISGNTGKLFVNGSLVNTNTSMTLNPSVLKTMSNYLGRSQFLADPFFNGRLDDVRIADYALTDAQIAALASGSAGNFAPAFTSDPINKRAALQGEVYSGSLIYNAGDIDAGDTLTFSKVSGPAWLSVASDGAISGTPGFGDLGVNSFTVRVTDNSAASDNATLNITVSGFGLRTHYKFENNANDSIGSKHGTVTGGPSYTTGKIGQAIDLDAVDDYVTLPAGLVNTDDITIAAWVNWDGGNQWQRIFDFGNNTSQYMFLSPRSGGDTLRFAITTAGNGGEQVMQTTQLATGLWVHVAVTLNGNVGRLYVNGVQTASNSSMTINPSDFNPAINYIGDSQWSADPLFNGRIDDFRIYNYALSAANIATLANGAANNPPYFTSDPISSLDAIEDAAYSGQTLAASAVDLDGDTLTFSKVNGPVWLAVASNGSLSGTPADSDTGNNVFTVRVEDTAGLYDTAGLTIDVANIYDMEDLAGLVAQWLAFNCTDIPACDGADLDGDADVDFFDFAQLANNWQQIEP
jgi:hypothetical protein